MTMRIGCGSVRSPGTADSVNNGGRSPGLTIESEEYRTAIGLAIGSNVSSIGNITRRSTLNRCDESESAIDVAETTATNRKVAVVVATRPALPAVDTFQRQNAHTTIPKTASHTSTRSVAEPALPVT